MYKEKENRNHSHFLSWELYEIEILSHVIQHRPTSAPQLITRDHTDQFLYSPGVESLCTRQHSYLTRNSHLRHLDSLGFTQYTPK